ncbi:MAG: protein kinase [Planctomycetota bacterium]|nr:protein kinase [Planctomycetota bacterium]
MSNPEDLPNMDEKPPVTEGIGPDSSLEKTHVFCGHSTPAKSGQAATSSEVAATSSSDGVKPTTKGQSRTVGGYRLNRLLGEGGMGRVYQASDKDGRMVAIKLLSAELSRSPEALERFKLEGIIASAISHPHCVFVHRADDYQGTPFIAMELMTGQTLKDLVAKRGPLPVDEVIPLILQCIDGLIEAHSRGMIHRDIKPANCYLDDKGNVKIGDFGLARSLISDSELTRTGAFLGTPLYASPEQILGETVDEQSDIYSLAATLYFMLAGNAPFESPNAPQVIAKIVSADPPVFTEAGVKVPKKLEQVVLRGLARDRTKRFGNFQQFRDELVQSIAQADRTASLTRRSIAYGIDTFLISMSITFVVFAFYGIADTRNELSLTIQILATTWQFLYFLTSEAIFGTTIGKRLLNLRVVLPETGDRPDFLNCLIRVAVFFAAINWIEFASTLILNAIGLGTLEVAAFLVGFSWLGFSVGCLTIVSVWKSTGRKKLLHEWLSNTETWVSVQKSITGSIELPTPNWTLPLQSPELGSAIPSQLGRFEVRGRLETTDGTHWLMAHDSTIDRAVWIQISPANCPPPSESREKCTRRTRMRFLETGVHGDVRWDAYVAPDGAPIALWFDHCYPMPWSVTRQVLNAAIDEIGAGEMNVADPATGISRWWLTSTGKSTLSEAPVQLGKALVPQTVGHKPLFAELAYLALPDRRRSTPTIQRIKPSKSIAASVPPWRATQLIQNLKAAKLVDPGEIKKSLLEIDEHPQIVTATMRMVHAAMLGLFLSVPWLTLVVALMIPAIVSVVEEQKDSQSFVNLAAILKDPDRFSKSIDSIEEHKRDAFLKPERVAKLEQAVEDRFEHFKKAYSNLGFMERTILEQQNRIRGRNDFTSKPQPDFSKIENADRSGPPDEEINSRLPKIKISSPVRNSPSIQVKDSPETISNMILRFEKWETPQEIRTPQPWIDSELLGRVLSLCLVPVCVLSVWGGFFRGGLTHFLTGLAVVRRDGRRAGILRSTWRSMLFWIPYFVIASGIFLLDTHGTDWIWLTQQLRRCFLILPLVYILIAIRYPQRGPHDVVSGTFLVPR